VFIQVLPLLINLRSRKSEWREKPVVDAGAALSRGFREGGSVKDVSGHFVKDVMELNKHPARVGHPAPEHLWDACLYSDAHIGQASVSKSAGLQIWRRVVCCSAVLAKFAIERRFADP
jgi:hypothetical protein